MWSLSRLLDSKLLLFFLIFCSMWGIEYYFEKWSDLLSFFTYKIRIYLIAENIINERMLHEHIGELERRSQTSTYDGNQSSHARSTGPWLGESVIKWNDRSPGDFATNALVNARFHCLLYLPQKTKPDLHTYLRTVMRRCAQTFTRRACLPIRSKLFPSRKNFQIISLQNFGKITFIMLTQIFLFMLCGTITNSCAIAF